MPEMTATETRPRALEQQFESLEAQHDARKLGMWIFLATEVMFFGGLFMTYTLYRELYLSGFEQGSHLLEVKWGALNTGVLILSSLTMALAVRSAQVAARKFVTIGLLGITMLLGTAFLAIKFLLEWRHDYIQHLIPGINFAYAGPYAAHVQLFFCFYFFMTALHALHLIIGIGILAVLAILTWRGRF
ncbi:MAG: cytochrome c oxidase subunit 3 [Candidatus Acidiferrales bacterium]